MWFNHGDTSSSWTDGPAAGPNFYAENFGPGKDLAITKENDKVVIAFAYDKVIPMMGSVNLLIKYEGRSK